MTGPADMLSSVGIVYASEFEVEVKLREFEVELKLLPFLAITGLLRVHFWQEVVEIIELKELKACRHGLHEDVDTKTVKLST
jgi:hypothetical protein